MNKISVITAVSMEQAIELQKKGRIGDFNTLPQVNKLALKIVKDFVVEQVGYEELPIACLCTIKTIKDGSIRGDEIMQYLPINGKDSVIFQLEMPEDMIVSVKYSDFLRISEDMDCTNDNLDLEFASDELKDILFVGFKIDDSERYLSFIPFLDYDKCKFFAVLNKDFTTDTNIKFDNIEQVSLSRLTSFNN